MRQLLLPDELREAHLRTPTRQEGLAAAADAGDTRRVHAAADPQVKPVQRGPLAQEAVPEVPDEGT